MPQGERELPEGERELPEGERELPQGERELPVLPVETVKEKRVRMRESA